MHIEFYCFAIFWLAGETCEQPAEINRFQHFSDNDWNLTCSIWCKTKKSQTPAISTLNCSSLDMHWALFEQQQAVLTHTFHIQRQYRVISDWTNDSWNFVRIILFWIRILMAKSKVFRQNCVRQLQQRETFRFCLAFGIVPLKQHFCTYLKSFGKLKNSRFFLFCFNSIFIEWNKNSFAIDELKWWRNKSEKNPTDAKCEWRLRERKSSMYLLQI